MSSHLPEAVETGEEQTDITADLLTGVSPQTFLAYVAAAHDLLVSADLTNTNISEHVQGPLGEDTTWRTLMIPHILLLPQPRPVTFVNCFKSWGRFDLPGNQLLR
ncbi:hypothetical protein RF11_13828 [Thelohanellus kitauei]|uniref:Uncharacterized protein n=1 Tax=Thelohanellus kitauei TaxID=669202 RepID=A0A0C2J071_THEKT|nr:hypothetical protein RF11_13828 [Thelohanellus kitauei]